MTLALITLAVAAIPGIPVAYVWIRRVIKEKILLCLTTNNSQKSSNTGEENDDRGYNNADCFTSVGIFSWTQS